MKTLFYGGNIITMAEPLYAEAVLVEDGKIIAVGSEEELRNDTDELVNLNGATMLPGFIDSHSHITSYAATFLQANAREINNYEKLKKVIDEYIEKNSIPSGGFVFVREFDHTVFPDGKYPTLEELDALAPEHVLVVRHNSGHAQFLNSCALKHFGITAEMGKDCPDEIITEDGKLTGTFKEGGLAKCNVKLPTATFEEICKAHPMLQRYYAENGITTAQEGFLSSRTIDVYKKLQDDGDMILDIIPYAPIRYYEPLLDKYNSLVSEENRHFGGIKYFLDGSPQLRTAWTRAPYLDSDSCGLPLHTDEEVTDAFRFAADRNAQIIIHTNGDGAAAQFLRCLEVAEKEKPNLKSLRPVLIHGQLMGRDQMAKAAELGVIVSFFVAHCFYYADTHIRNLGSERGIYVSAVKSAIDAGITVTFHQDAPVIEPDMLESVWCAVNRVTRNGVELAKDECISVLDALKAVTINVAYQYFEEDKKGSIETGKLADFAVLDKNPLTVPKETIRDIKVLKTYKKGKCIYSKEN